MIRTVFDRWRNLDWILMGALLFLSAVSLVSLASYNQSFFWRQLIWYVAAFFVILLGSGFNWSWLLRWPVFRYGLYWLSVTLLLISNFQSQTIRGTKSWLIIGGFQFEPEEIAKLAIVILLAGFFTRRYLATWRAKNLFISFFYAIVPAGLVAIHPDLGSTIVILSIWLGFILMSGIHKKRLLIGIGVVVVAFVLLWTFFLKPYQRDRLTAFMFPERDPLGINYNVIQSKIAIGSAGFWGRGFGEGTQTQLHFLPEAQTDFIFAAFTEEWGILGATLLILTFLIIIFRLINISLRTGSNDAKFVIFGCALIFFMQFLINVGANLGLVPVTGITLPFVSYGGSSLLTIAILISIIQHIKLESSG
ncbi:rod shape-determining protein RodA [bacterium]|nr:MAG: rod shape-determining protein RodA [bacterium]